MNFIQCLLICSVRQSITNQEHYAAPVINDVAIRHRICDWVKCSIYICTCPFTMHTFPEEVTQCYETRWIRGVYALLPPSFVILDIVWTLFICLAKYLSPLPYNFGLTRTLCVP
ncbi:hypothetical protein FKM82_027728 [Ascaphus truei]